MAPATSTSVVPAIASATRKTGSLISRISRVQDVLKSPAPGAWIQHITQPGWQLVWHIGGSATTGRRLGGRLRPYIGLSGRGAPGSSAGEAASGDRTSRPLRG